VNKRIVPMVAQDRQSLCSQGVGGEKQGGNEVKNMSDYHNFMIETIAKVGKATTDAEKQQILEKYVNASRLMGQSNEDMIKAVDVEISGKNELLKIQELMKSSESLETQKVIFEIKETENFDKELKSLLESQSTQVMNDNLKKELEDSKKDSGGK
jgi:hypothetical protein